MDGGVQRGANSSRSARNAKEVDWRRGLQLLQRRGYNADAATSMTFFGLTIVSRKGLWISMEAKTTIVDDNELMALAADRTLMLFPVMNRTKAMWPLLFMLATIPALLALQNHSFDTSDARWGLLAIESVTTPEVVVNRQDSPTNQRPVSRTTPNGWVPPVGMWWNALFLFLACGQSLWSLYFGSYIGTVLEIGACYLLGRRLFGPQLNFWAVVLLSFHACVLEQVQSPAPVSLAVFLSLITFWGFISHRQNSDDLFSWRLIISGVAMGLCAMTAGALALLLLAVMLIHVLSLRGTVRLGRRRSNESPRKGWIGWAALRSLGVVTLTGVAVGGVIFLQTWGISGWGTMHWGLPWLESVTPWIADNQIGFDESSGWHAILFLLRSALGLSVLGFVSMTHEMLHTDDSVRRRRLQFILAWSSTAVAVWFFTWIGLGASAFLTGLWQAFSLPPIAILAGYAVEEIRHRKCRLPLIGMVWGSSLAGILLIKQINMADSWEKNTTAVVALFILTVAFILFLWFEGWWLINDRRRRLFVSVMLLMILLTHVTNGLCSILKMNDDDVAIRSLQIELREYSGVSRCVLISDVDSPAQLQYLATTVWPQAELTLTDGWSRAVSQWIETSDVDAEGATGATVILDWRKEGETPVTMQSRRLTLQTIAARRFFGNKQLNAYRLSVD